MGIGLLTKNEGGVHWSLALIWMSLFGLGGWAGFNLIKHKTGLLGPALTFWLLQVPFFQNSFMCFSFSTGLAAIVAYHPSQIKFDLFLLVGSRLEYAVLNPVPSSMIGINVFALIIVFFICMQLAHSKDHVF